MANNTYVQTVSGVQPAPNTPLEFEISTQAAETFIRDRIKDISDSRRRIGEYVPNINYDDVRMCTMTFSKRFAPFLLAMPDSILDRAEYDPNCPSMFQNVDGVLKIIEDYFNFIKGFTYKNEDIKLIRTSSFARNNLGLEGNNIHEFTYYTQFRNKPFDADDEYVNANIIFIEIDPGRLFHSMLKNKTAINQRFNAIITNVTFTGTNLATYTVNRSPVSRNNKDKRDKRQRSIVVSALANMYNN